MQKSRIGPLLLAIGIPLLAIGLLYFAVGTVYAASVELSQCANGGNNEAEQCRIDPGGGNIGWINGNANANKSTYQIGQFIAYRFIFDDLTPGYFYCGAMAWDVAEGNPGKPAVDYISSYSHTMKLADPTLGTIFSGTRESPQTVASNWPDRSSGLSTPIQKEWAFTASCLSFILNVELFIAS